MRVLGKLYSLMRDSDSLEIFFQALRHQPPGLIRIGNISVSAVKTYQLRYFLSREAHLLLEDHLDLRQKKAHSPDSLGKSSFRDLR
jgi:hypothetical protein